MGSNTVLARLGFGFVLLVPDQNLGKHLFFLPSRESSTGTNGTTPLEVSSRLLVQIADNIFKSTFSKKKTFSKRKKEEEESQQQTRF